MATARHIKANDGMARAPHADGISQSDDILLAPHFPVAVSGTGLKRRLASPSQRALTDIVQARENFTKSGVADNDDDGSRCGRLALDDEITPATSQRYLHRTQILLARYRRECDIHDYDRRDGYKSLNGFDVAAFAVWLLSLKPDLSPSTWRFYRRAAYHTMSSLPDDGVDAALSLLDNDRTLNESRADSDGASKRGQTSLQKFTFFEADDFDLIQRTLQFRSARSTTPLILRDWLIAGISVGLRPLEWRATAVETVTDPAHGEQLVLLFVMNPKTTNLRGNGVMRTLDISNLHDEAIGAVLRMSEVGRSWSLRGAFDEEHGKIAKHLSAMDRSLFRRQASRYSLYSCRHQFIANMSGVFSPAELATLAGSDLSGRQLVNAAALKQIWPSEVIARHPRPITSEVATIQNIMDLNAERQKFRTRRR